MTHQILLKLFIVNYGSHASILSLVNIIFSHPPFKNWGSWQVTQGQISGDRSHGTNCELYEQC